MLIQRVASRQIVTTADETSVVILILPRTASDTNHFLPTSVLVCTPKAEQVLVTQLRDQERKVRPGLSHSQRTQSPFQLAQRAKTHIHGQDAFRR